jgi:hypothetical protein
VSAAACTRGVVDSAPTAPSPTITALTITPIGGGSLLVGSSAPITTTGNVTPANATALGAYAQFSSGSGRYVEASWTSSDAGIIAVEGTELVARGRGSVTLTATFEGRSDTETFSAEGGIGGRWAGTYLVEQCSGNSGSIHEVLCNPAGNARPVGLAAVGATLPFSLEISENGSDLAATVVIGQVRGTLTGRTRGAGYFYLQGLIADTGGTITIVHWDTRVVRDELEGFIGYQMKLPGLPGFGSVAAKLTGVTRR